MTVGNFFVECAEPSRRPFIVCGDLVEHEATYYRDKYAREHPGSTFTVQQHATLTSRAKDRLAERYMLNVVGVEFDEALDHAEAVARNCYRDGMSDHAHADAINLAAYRYADM